MIIATCPHCALPLSPKGSGSHAARCASATPRERAFYAEHRRWPLPLEGVTRAELAAEAQRLRGVLLSISTDLAQDALEDPCGHADRRAAGFVRLAASQADALQEALR